MPYKDLKIGKVKILSFVVSLEVKFSFRSCMCEINRSVLMKLFKSHLFRLHPGGRRIKDQIGGDELEIFIVDYTSVKCA